MSRTNVVSLLATSMPPAVQKPQQGIHALCSLSGRNTTVQHGPPAALTMVTCQEGNLGVPCQRRSSSAGPRSSDLASIHILILWHFIDATVALTTTMSGYTPFRHPSQVGYHLVPLVLPLPLTRITTTGKFPTLVLTRTLGLSWEYYLQPVGIAPRTVSEDFKHDRT